MSDSYTRTRMFRELVALYLNAEGAPGHWRPTVPAKSLAETFARPEGQGDLVHDLGWPLVLRIRNEVRYEPAEALREARETARAAAIGNEFVPYFALNRRRSDARVDAGDTYAMTDVRTLSEIIKRLHGNRIG